DRHCSSKRDGESIPTVPAHLTRSEGPEGAEAAVFREYRRKAARWTQVRSQRASVVGRLASSGCISFRGRLLFCFAGVFVVFLCREKIRRLVLIEEANTNHPSVSVRLFVDLFRRRAQRLVYLDHLTGHRDIQF